MLRWDFSPYDVFLFLFAFEDYIVWVIFLIHSTYPVIIINRKHILIKSQTYPQLRTRKPQAKQRLLIPSLYLKKVRTKPHDASYRQFILFQLLHFDVRPFTILLGEICIIPLPFDAFKLTVVVADTFLRKFDVVRDLLVIVKKLLVVAYCCHFVGREHIIELPFILLEFLLIEEQIFYN